MAIISVANSIKASEEGLTIIAKAAKQKGWSKQSQMWISQAFTSLATLKRFWARKQIDRDNFISICRAVGIENFKLIAEPRQDLRQAPEINLFCGRSKELMVLRQWILDEQCRLVGIFGMGGVGKTALSLKLAQEIKDHFEFVYWYSIREAPAASEMVGDMLQFLSEQQKIDFSDQLTEKMNQMVDFLRRSRCLIVIDNAESVLSSENDRHAYQKDSEGYGELFKFIVEQSHQSCLLITSRHILPEFLAFDGLNAKVQSLSLSGLQIEARSIFDAKKIVGTESEYHQLISLYHGNPKALEIVSSHIRELYAGSLADYLAELSMNNETILFHDIKDLLKEQLDRLTDIERQVIYWLAVNREPTLIGELNKDLLISNNKIVLSEILLSLKRQSLLEKVYSQPRYTLQNVIMEYITEELVLICAEEIISGQLVILNSHALMKAQAKDYIRDAQTRLIIGPLVQYLLHRLGSQRLVEERILHVLEEWKKRSAMSRGYVVANLLHLLIYIGADLKGHDFSHLYIRQAYLRNTDLREVNFFHSHFDRSVFSEKFSSILTVCLRPDGKILATGDTNGEVRLWDATTGVPIATLQGHSHWIRDLAFNPGGNRLISGSSDQTARIWDVSDPTTTKWLHTLEGHQHAIWSVTFSSDGSKVATASDDKTARVWDAYNGQSLEVFGDHSFWVRFVAFSNQDKILVSGSADQQVSLWSLANNDLIRRWQIKESQVRAASLSPDGQLLATGGDDNKVRLWNVHTGSIHTTLQGHQFRIWAVDICPTGTRLASGSTDGLIKIWDLENGECLQTLSSKTGRLRALSFSEDGRTLAAGGDDQGLMLWDVMSGKSIHSIKAYVYRQRSICYGKTTSMLLSGSDDNSARLWDLKTGKTLQIFSGHKGSIRAVAISQCGCYFATGSHDQTIKIWETYQGKCIQTLVGHKDWVWSVGFSSDGNHLVSAADDQTIRYWDVKTGQCRLRINHALSWSWNGAFDAVHSIFASADEDQCIRFWDIGHGECVGRLAGHSASVRSVAFSADGNYLVSGSDDQTVRVWQWKDDICLHVLTEPKSTVRSVTFSGDARLLACANDRGDILIWESISGHLIISIKAHMDPILSIAFDTDGETIASASEDETIKIWSIESGKLMKTLQPEKLYQGMNIAQCSGLTIAQEELLLLLGAIN